MGDRERREAEDCVNVFSWHGAAMATILIILDTGRKDEEEDEKKGGGKGGHRRPGDNWCTNLFLLL